MHQKLDPFEFGLIASAPAATEPQRTRDVREARERGRKPQSSQNQTGLRLAAIVLAIPGCSAASSHYLTAGKDVTLSVNAVLVAGRSVQSLVNPITPASVDHLDFSLQTSSGSIWAEIASNSTPAGSGTTKTSNFLHLKMNTTYKVIVKARDAAGNDLTKADGSGTATVSTGIDNWVPLTVTVDLADVTYDGTLHPVVNVSSGSVVNTTQPEVGVIAPNQ